MIVVMLTSVSALSGLLVATVTAVGLLQEPPAKPARDAEGMTAEELRADIERRHPADYYRLAGMLFAQDRKRDAAFYFYLGQLRYRFHLAANPNLRKGEDEALFASLSEALGSRINEWAFGDLRQLIITFDKVLDWDDFHENGFTSKAEHEARWNDTREGLFKLCEHVRLNLDQIRAERTKNGLENRSDDPPMQRCRPPRASARSRP
jgi:hypothetical protein